MLQILFKYLVINRQVNVPGVGVLSLTTSPARLNQVSKTIDPPRQRVHFKQEVATADRSFFRFASQEMGVEDWESIRRFHDLTFKIKNDLDKGVQVELPGIGLFTKDGFGTISFTAAQMPNEYFEPVTMPRAKSEASAAPVQQPAVLAASPATPTATPAAKSTAATEPVQAVTGSLLTDEIVDDEPIIVRGSGVEHLAANEKSKNWWWIVAVVLAMAAVGAIVYYYLNMQTPGY